MQEEVWGECDDLVITLCSASEWCLGDTPLRMQGANRDVKMGIESGNGNNFLLGCNLCHAVWSIQQMHTSFILSKQVHVSCVHVPLWGREQGFFMCACNCVGGVHL